MTWKLLLLMTALAGAGGCAGEKALIASSARSQRGDVFREQEEGVSLQPGYADLQIASSLKTHNRGKHAQVDLHGTPGYRLLINIDGQATQIQGIMAAENMEPRGLRDQESGDGARYLFRGLLRLKAGVHRIVVATPADGVAEEREVTLSEGNNDLVLEPVYGVSPGSWRGGLYGTRSYKEGIKWFRLLLNGREV